MIKNKDASSVKPGNSVVINNTYNSPKPASIRELKRQDEIQMRRLAMQLNFKPASIRELKRQDEIQMRRLAMQLNF